MKYGVGWNPCIGKSKLQAQVMKKKSQGAGGHELIFSSQVQRIFDFPMRGCQETLLHDWDIIDDQKVFILIV